MLERSEWKFRHSSQFYSEQERLKMAQDYLAVNHFMKVADYCRLTGLLRDKAARELKRWTEQPETGIDYRGQGSHKIYMVRSNLWVCPYKKDNQCIRIALPGHIGIFAEETWFRLVLKWLHVIIVWSCFRASKIPDTIDCGYVSDRF